jgi:thiosulfate/3-mercaptopyruvate sulfurtransferase
MSSPVAERGYARPELLAETDWLAEHIDDPTIRVVDARTDEDYAAGHIDGAVLISGFSLGGIRGASEGMPQPAAFAEMVGALGIDDQTTVVVYDTGGVSQMAGMTAWAFLYYGANVRYLDGGLMKWTAEGRPVSTDLPAHEPRTFAA